MRETAKRSLQAAYGYFNVRVKTLQILAIDRERPVGTPAALSSRGIRVVETLFQRNCVVRHHAVDVSSAHHEAVLRLSKLHVIGVAQRLRDNSDREPSRFDHSRDYRNSEGRVVDVSVTGEADEIKLLYPSFFHILSAYRQKRHFNSLTLSLLEFPLSPFLFCHQNLTGLAALERSDYSHFFHYIDKPRGSSIAQLEPSLQR